MNAMIILCSPQIAKALATLNEQMQDGKIDAANYNRKMLELQAEVEKDKNHPIISLTKKQTSSKIRVSEIGEL